LPLACAWAEEQEQLILKKGVGLTEAQMADARRIGVAARERVRLLQVEEIPLPEHPGLRAAAREAGLLTPETAGLTLGYGIFIRSPFWETRKLIVHELVHVSQYEKLGGLEPFLSKYLWECVTLGYAQAPMEYEAQAMAEEICVSV
jgi:hypothetical protein